MTLHNVKFSYRPKTRFHSHNVYYVK
ncbi:hypothetical protein CBM2626_A120006 [Cupriavidus taiwanensis]|nr:hypothetical protein CBM2626_A120006 [Cupriavidus taiwanensis]